MVVLGFCCGWVGWWVLVLLWVDRISVGDNVSPNLSVRGRHVPSPLHPYLSGSGVSGSTISPVSDAVYRTPIPPEPQSRASSSLRRPLSCLGCAGYFFSGPSGLYSLHLSTLRILAGNQVLQSQGTGQCWLVWVVGLLALLEIEDLFTVNNPPVLRLGALGIVGLL